MPRRSPFEIRDTSLKGFILRVQPSGSMSYICEYARGRRITLGAASVLKPAEARDQARLILADAAKGIDPMEARRKRRGQRTFKQFLERDYVPWVEANRRSGGQIGQRLRSTFGEALESRSLSEITAWQIEKWRSRRLKNGIKASTVNRDIAALKAALSRAVDWGLLESHPLRGVKQLRTDDAAAVRFLTSQEEKALRKALDDREKLLRGRRLRGNEWRSVRGYKLLPVFPIDEPADCIKPMVLLSLNTGLRRGEVFDLTWGNVDLDRALLTVQGSGAKSGKTRHVPLNSEALMVLKHWEHQSTAKLVFPGRHDKRLVSVRKAWSTLLIMAGLKKFRWHDMRHHFASRLVMNGVDLNTVRELLGHSDIKMTLRYAHLAPEHKATAVEKLVGTGA